MNAQAERAVVELVGVTKYFGSEQVLAGVDLCVARGTVTALLGRNGSGKSTTLRIVGGLLARDGGEARVFGRDAEALTLDERGRLAWVTDASSAWAGTRVKDELALVRRVRAGRWSAAREQELVARFEIPLTKRLGALSKGQQTRLRIAMALAAEPELLLMDEPALGLDAFARRDLLESIVEAVDGGCAVLISSHLLEDVERVADQVCLLRQGRIVASGTLDELRERYRRVRFAVPPGSEARFTAAVAHVSGFLRLTVDLEGSRGERVAVIGGYDDARLAELEAQAGVRQLDVRRMSLAEIYLEVLAGAEEHHA